MSTVRIIILMYHSINKHEKGEDKRYTCPPLLFKKHLSFLKNHGYNFLSLSDLNLSLQGKKTLSEKNVVITFDDGFEDNYSLAFPILKVFNVPATIFLVSDLMGKTNEWMINESYKKKNMLSWEQIQEMLDSNIEFGGHTLNHKRLTMVDDTGLHDQIIKNKQNIEKFLGKKLIAFAYPYGLYNQDVIDVVSLAGYTVACSTRSGFNTIKTEPLQLRRLEIMGTDSVSALKRKITFGTNDSSLFFPVKYYLSRLREKLGLSR